MSDPEEGHPQRITVPYAPVTWVAPRTLARVLVVAADDALRGRLAASLRGEAWMVVTAPHRDSARSLCARLEPDVVVAELETIAPDFEPLRPALDQQFGDAPWSSVVLVSDAPLREPIGAIKAVVPAGVEGRDLVHALEPLLTRD
jgi:hypothetical protein